MSSVGRNDPCPCGSGRKHKRCCLPIHDEEDARRLRLRAAEGEIVPALYRYAGAALGPEFFAEAWQEFFLWQDVPEDIEQSEDLGTTFEAFFAFEFVVDATDLDEALVEDWPAEPLALHFLHNAAGDVPEFHRRFIEQSCASPASLFAVEAAIPGRSLDLKDILTGRRLRVLEQNASRTLNAGDLLYTRVVTLDGASIMIGAGPWAIPAAWHSRVIDVRESINRDRMLTRAEVADHAMAIRETYHAIVTDMLQPQHPALENTDGDPLELTVLVYELGVDPADAIARLTPLATLDGDVHIDNEVRDASGSLTGATLTWLKRGNRQHRSWDTTVLGTVTVDGTRLEVHVNSARRRQKAEKQIAKLLGPSARLVDVSTSDLEDLPVDVEPRDEEPDPALAGIEAELVRQHWDAWFDMKIPALGNRTPRQAARSPKGRERLDALLTHYAAMSPGRGSLAPDIEALKRTLGLL